MDGRPAIDGDLFDAPNLPTWKHPVLRDIEPDLQLLGDCWLGLRGSEATYLPQETKEPDRAYRNRLARATYVPSFRKAIEAMSGILSQFTLSDLPASLEQQLDDIDQLGNNLTAFMAMADSLAMRDGGCAVMVEMPQQVAVESEADRLAFGRQPYLVLLERRNILNWKTEYIAGQEQLVQATLLEWREVEAGSFGFTVEPFFRVLTPGAFQVYALNKQLGATTKLQLVEEGFTSLTEVPLVWYSPQPQRWGHGLPPFRELALLTLQHYRSRSDLNELLHRCALPVPVRRGALLMDGQTPPPLVIGPNSVVDVPVDGDFRFAEPSGSSLQQQQEHLRHIEQLINNETLAFMSGQEAVTATQARLQAGQVQSGLTLAGMQKASLFEQLQMLWVAYTGEEPTGSLQIAAQALESRLEPQQVAQIQSLADGGYISKETTLELLQRGGVLPIDFDVEAEVLGLDGSDQQQLQAQLKRDRLLLEQNVMLPPQALQPGS
jgi:hypothetical protein